MSHRKEVFQSKVLQKLYPAATQKQEKEPSPPHIVKALAKKTYKQIKACGEGSVSKDADKTQSAAKLGRRMYTVLPPPADYRTDPEKCVTLHQREGLNCADNPAEESVPDEEPEQDKEVGQKRKRRKRKPALHTDSEKDGASHVRESSVGQSQTPEDDGGESISRNKKRKLKKKRHKEKLISMGLVPRATALEFTYKREEEEVDELALTELSHFLRTTMETYMSDSSCAEKLPLLPQTLDDLLSGIASRHKPTSVLKQLCCLKTFVQQTESGKLEKALEELQTTSSLSADESAAVVTLFQYWITDVLPVQGDKKTSPSAAHP
ncbi:uncharacterized protein V6R79_016476 [Siganus canaliculatus]